MVEVTGAEQNESLQVFDDSTPPHTPIVSAPSGRARAPSVAVPALSVEKNVSFAPTQNNGIRNRSGHRKSRTNSHHESFRSNGRKMLQQTCPVKVLNTRLKTIPQTSRMRTLHQRHHKGAGKPRPIKIPSSIHTASIHTCTTSSWKLPTLVVLQ